MDFFTLLIIALVLQVVAYMLRPKPKQPKRETQDLEMPTAEAGRPIPYVFGKITIKSPNVLWYGEKDVYDYKVKA